MMNENGRSEGQFHFRLEAVFCALSVLFAAALVQPQLEMSVNDDWSYIRTAQLFAQTGHVIYNGWAAPIIGWLLIPAAMLIKAFGFSFTVVRMTTLGIAIMTAFMLQRTFVRMGLRERNASIATLTLTLSPLFLPLSLSFMTDVPGFFVVVVCLYGCLRAMQATRAGATVGWICFAIVSNAIGGTARQIAWLGMLVMVPSALWLLRRRPKVVAYGVPVLLMGLLFMAGVLHWFKLQPYAVPESVIPEGHHGWRQLAHLVKQFEKVVLEFPLFLLPVLAAFGLALARRRGGAVGLGIACLGVALLLGVPLARGHAPERLLEPVMENYVTLHGVIDGTPIQGERPIVLSLPVRAGLSALVFVGVFSFFAVLWMGRGKRVSEASQPAAISLMDLSVLLLPFSLAYVGLLAPRAAVDTVFDRYLIIVIAVALVFVVRVYQRDVAPQLHWLSVAVVTCMAAYSVAATHDAYSMLRGRLAAIEQMRASGIPAEAIDGGFEFNGWTQVTGIGHVTSPYVKNPRTTFSPNAFAPAVDGCEPEIPYLFSGLVPRYALSFNPALCGGPAGFAPVVYETWLAPHRTAIYAIRYAVR